MKLLHYHIPGLSSYRIASAIQESLVNRALVDKASGTKSTHLPVIITAQFHPVYTCGRREIGNIGTTQQAYLQAEGRAQFVEALRGGQTTFHGPGQLVAYPIIDLKTHKLSPRSYVCALEKSLISTCAEYGISATTTENTGVWTTADDKIAAIGVHMRRHITSHGIGLNVNTDLWWFDRIVACGLEGKRTTSFEKEGVLGKSVEEVGVTFVQKLAKQLNIYTIHKEEVLESFT